MLTRLIKVKVLHYIYPAVLTGVGVVANYYVLGQQIRDLGVEVKGLRVGV